MRLTTKICVKFEHAEISLASSFCVNFLANRLDEEIIFTTRSRQLVACGTNDNLMQHHNRFNLAQFLIQEYHNFGKVINQKQISTGIKETQFSTTDLDLRHSRSQRLRSEFYFLNSIAQI